MAAEKGNKYALGNNGGRPALFETPEELNEAIRKYFEEDHKTRVVVVGKAPNNYEVILPVITVTGLALYLGFESRQSLYDYEDKKEFSYIIKRARLFIEEEYEEQLQHGNTTGAIFALKNMGWSDKTEVDHTTKGESMNKKPDLSKLQLSTLKQIESDLNGDKS